MMEKGVQERFEECDIAEEEADGTDETPGQLLQRVREVVRRQAGQSVGICVSRLRSLVEDDSEETPPTVQRLAALDLIELAGARPPKQVGKPQVVIQLPSMKDIEGLLRGAGAGPEDLVAIPVEPEPNRLISAPAAGPDEGIV